MWLLLLLACSAEALRDLAPPPPAISRTSRSDPVEGWLSVRLNHFKASNNDTFPMRYYYNDEFATDGNIVIFVGGEWAIHPGWTQAGLAYEVAQATGAALFYTEHRFYGNTRPSASLQTGQGRRDARKRVASSALAEESSTKKKKIHQNQNLSTSYAVASTSLAPIANQNGPCATTAPPEMWPLWTITSQLLSEKDTSVEDLRFLSVDQALGDLAQFIQHVKSDSFENGKYKDGAVALVGCSYAGSMATWMRLAYPHLVDAVFSDSGPLHAQEDFPEYLEVITEALRSQGSEACVASVAEAIEQLLALLDTTTGAQTVSDMFNTCSSIQAGAPLDLATFFWFGITETFAYLVQYATPGDISGACAVLTDSSVSDPVQRLATWVRSQEWTQPCIESRYSVVLAEHTNTSYDAPQSVMRLWTYQTCVEYGWYQTTSSDSQPFGGTVPLEYFHQMCRDFFSSYFDENLLRAGISRTNLLFGGLTHLPDRVVSVAGGLDPWAPMGPTAEHATPKAPVYVVPTVSHCRAIQSTATSETQALGDAKRAVIDHLVYWMTGQRNAAHAPAGVLGIVLVAASLLL